ncbi:MFS family permease [Paucibacter oligotrophus]|uniref:MFS family permease n=1 Tax=Roseateles oligotrophus TaxID=1769250 RepID=A0A840LA53_9BURK|nr:MFS transporter [Roseateles oligotrophus]MBB4843645.1 MFS family permease [Roseateles oligotrophus]
MTAIAEPALPSQTAADDQERDGRGRPLWRQGSLVYGLGGLVVLFAFLLIGDFAWSLKERAVTPMAQVLLRQLQASDFFIALVVGSFPAALGLLLGPVVAVRSDRHRGRMGRRIPYLLLPMPLVVGGLLGMAVTPQAGALLHDLLGGLSPGLRLCNLAWFALMWTLFEVASVTANAVFGGLIADVVPARLTGRFYGLFRATGLLAGIGFTYHVLGHAQQYFAWIFSGIALIYGLGFALMCWRVREGSYPPPEPAAPGAQGAGEVRRYLRECFSQRFYLLLFFAMMLGLVAGNPINGFGVFYAQQVGLGLDGYGKALALTYTCSLLLALPVGWLADRWHPLRVGLVSIALYALAMLAAGCWVRDAQQFSQAFIVHGVLSGIYLTGTAALGQYLFPRERFAQFHSAMNLLAALGYMLVPPAMGAWLDATGHHYHHTFIVSGVLAAVSGLLYLWLLRPFQALGGPGGYRAP